MSASINRDELDARRPRRREVMALRYASDRCYAPALKLRLSGRIDLAREFDLLQVKLRAELRKVEAAADAITTTEPTE